MHSRLRILEDKAVNLALRPQMNIPTISDEQLWQAVDSKDASFDGRFVFAVSSTGIYCRPSCPSRRPRRDRVTFFSLPDGAEQAGFRACLRCRPRDLTEGDKKVEVVRRACELLNNAED